MRAIKFRVWHILTKEYLDPSWHYLNGNGQFCLHVPYESPSPVVNRDNYIIQQFTGLTDKEGKAIYEGDILKASVPAKMATNPFDYRDVFRKVIWDEEKACFRADGAIYGFYDDDACLMPWCEVVGNFFQNPELLT